MYLLVEPNRFLINICLHDNIANDMYENSKYFKITLAK